MNTIYKILWIEDSDDYIEMTQEIIEDVVRQNKMFPSLVIYKTYEAFRKTELDNFDAEIFNLYDQIIVDFALSGTTGDKIIQELRQKNIFTDIVFYSSNFQRLKDEVRNSEEQLDGVFYANREDLTSAIDKVIKKNLKREYNIANIRGLLMDSTSEFDYVCRTATLELFDKLEDEKKQEVVNRAKEYVSNAESNAQSNFSKLEKLQGENFLKKALNATEYVMNNKDRYAVMAMVVREFLDDQRYDDSFSETYQSQLITPRNQLAHSKLFYGDCQKKLHIAKEKQEFVCDKQCDSCKSKYSIEECEKLRNIIFNYYVQFKELADTVDKL